MSSLAKYFLLVAFAALAVPNAFASELERAWRATDPWRKEGQLVTVHISRGNPIRIFVVGREEAKIDPSNLQLTIRRLKPYPGQVVQPERVDGYFVLRNDANVLQGAEELEVVTRVNDQEESFQIQLKPDDSAPASKPRKGKSK